MTKAGLEPSSLILIDTDEVFGSLLYLQSTGVRNDVIVLHANILNRDWYIKNESSRHPDVISADLTSLTAPDRSTRIERILKDNMSERSTYTMFPDWERRAPDFETVPIGILNQVVERGTDMQDLLNSNRAWQDYQLRGVKIGFYKDASLERIANYYRVWFNRTAGAYYEVGYFDEAEYLLRKASDIDPHQVLENNLDRIIKAKSDKE